MVEGAKPALGEAARRDREPPLLARVLAAQVEAEGLCRGARQEIRSFACDLVVDVTELAMRLAPPFRAVRKHKRPTTSAGIAVVGDVASGPVAADEGVGGVLARIDDVPQQVRPWDSARRASPGEAEAPEEDPRLLVVPVLDRHVAEEQEAPPCHQSRRQAGIAATSEASGRRPPSAPRAVSRSTARPRPRAAPRPPARRRARPASSPSSESARHALGPSRGSRADVWQAGRSKK